MWAGAHYKVSLLVSSHEEEEVSPLSFPLFPSVADSLRRVQILKKYSRPLNSGAIKHIPQHVRPPINM